MKLARIKLEQILGLPHLEWASKLSVVLPQYLATHLFLLGQQSSEHELVIKANTLNADTITLSQNSMYELRMHAAFTEKPPISSRLPMNYQYLPSFVRDFIAHSIGRIKRSQTSKWSIFPSWPLDLSTDFIADLGSHEPSPFSHGPTPVLLTHDLDTLEGLKNSVRYFLKIEETVGARSANYIVPSAWKIDQSLLNEISQRGHEIGIHGFDHSNKTPFLTSAERQKRLESALPLIKEYDIQGYRAPSLLRTKPLLQDLAKIYRYDSSIPTSGGAFPTPNNGCATARPFQIEGIWEIPLSMPRDGSLLFLGYSPAEILNTWINCANLIAKSGGVINLLTHCESRFSGKKSMQIIYQQFLEYLAENHQFKFVLPKDLVKQLGNPKS